MLNGRRLARQRVAHVTIGTMAAVIAFTGAVWADHPPFTDVPASNTHHDSIEAVRAAGVTQGCTPTAYCPSANVRRDQMASFMDRLGALSPGQTPVVNADKVDGLHASDLVVAGVHVTRDAMDAPVVDRWFNNINGTEPTVGGTDTYSIDFGFDATDKFLQCTIDTNFVDTRDAVCTASTPGGNLIRVRAHDVSEGDLQPAEFWLLVYGLAM